MTQTVLVAGEPVETTVTAPPGDVRQSVYATRWRLRQPHHRIVGLGVQWTQRFRAGADERPGTLQLCAGNRCLVFRIARAAGGRVPMVLRRFLAERLVKFAGRNIQADCRKLRTHHDLDVASTVELRRAGGMGSASMETMAERHLGIRGLTKSTKVGLSKWDGPRLSKKQVRYACVDAYLSYRLGVRLHLRRNDDG